MPPSAADITTEQRVFLDRDEDAVNRSFGMKATQNATSKVNYAIADSSLGTRNSENSTSVIY